MQFSMIEKLFKILIQRLRIKRLKFHKILVKMLIFPILLSKLKAVYYYPTESINFTSKSKVGSKKFEIVLIYQVYKVDISARSYKDG